VDDKLIKLKLKELIRIDNTFDKATFQTAQQKKPKQIVGI